MELRDTTLAVNQAPRDDNNYLYHLESANGRWAIAIEHFREAHFNVCVMYRDPDWDLHGVIRYWKCSARDMAEARFLALQNLFANLDADLALTDMLRHLPPEERHAPTN